MELTKTLEINKLINLYGAMLNEKQMLIMESYYFYNNSLSEIAEEFNITRQAVSDLLKRVVKTLYHYESKLNLLKKNNKIEVIAKKLGNALENEKNKNELQKILDILEE